MPDRETVIQHFQDAIEASGNNNKWRFVRLDIIEKAIALLKAQEHGETFTVIDNKTGKEADTYDIALHEDWAKHLCYCDMEGWAMEDDGTLLLVDECGRFAYADRERFKVKWDDRQGKND